MVKPTWAITSLNASVAHNVLNTPTRIEVELKIEDLLSLDDTIPEEDLPPAPSFSLIHRFLKD